MTAERINGLHELQIYRVHPVPEVQPKIGAWGRRNVVSELQQNGDQRQLLKVSGGDLRAISGAKIPNHRRKWVVRWAWYAGRFEPDDALDVGVLHSGLIDRKVNWRMSE